MLNNWLSAILFGLVLASLMLVCSMCQASSITQDKAILAIIGEAEGESYQGKVALAYALINRGTLKGVFGLTAQRVLCHKYSNKTYKEALRAYKQALNHPLEDITHGATHWEGTAFKTPYWAKGMNVTLTIGKQRFYKKGQHVNRYRTFYY